MSLSLMALRPALLVPQDGRMDPAPTIRLADADRDAAAIAAIYRAAVTSSIASFEEVAPDADEMAHRIRTTLSRLPWLVATDEGDAVIGYAYAGQHRERAGYRWSADISVYVDAARHGRGIGRAIYDALVPMLRRQGYANIYAGITLPNPASVALHEAIGMRRIGVYERVGWKFGAWHDVAWFGMRIAEPAEPPAEPIPLPQLRA
jgi:phosphinothricin acetyltransferase